MLSSQAHSSSTKESYIFAAAAPVGDVVSVEPVDDVSVQDSTLVDSPEAPEKVVTYEDFDQENKEALIISEVAVPMKYDTCLKGFCCTLGLILALLYLKNRLNQKKETVFLVQTIPSTTSDDKLSQAPTGPTPPQQQVIEKIPGQSLYAEMMKSQSENLVSSLYSIDTLLSMVLQGAKGNTYDQLAQFLTRNTFPVANKKAIEECLATQRTQCKELMEQDNLKIANGLFVSENYPVEGQFFVDTERDFQTMVEAVDFKDQEWVKSYLNEWVEEKTDGRIKNMFDDVSPETRLMLINAIAFEAEWKNSFLSRDTKTENFNLFAGGSEEVSMMNTWQEKKIHHVEDGKFKYIELPYSGDKFEMVLILPDDEGEEAFKEVEKSIAYFGGGDYDSAVTVSREKLVKVSLPKFQIQSEFDLTPMLENQGVIDVFNLGKADLSGISKLQLAAESIKQKAVIDVNETGTTAAAATSTLMYDCYIEDPEQEEDFNCNRPFFFVIKDKNTNAQLFTGRVQNPGKYIA